MDNLKNVIESVMNTYNNDTHKSLNSKNTESRTYDEEILITC